MEVFLMTLLIRRGPFTRYFRFVGTTLFSANAFEAVNVITVKTICSETLLDMTVLKAQPRPSWSLKNLRLFNISRAWDDVG